jgi:hypothetical protein
LESSPEIFYGGHHKPADRRVILPLVFASGIDKGHR